MGNQKMIEYHDKNGGVSYVATDRIVRIEVDPNNYQLGVIYFDDGSVVRFRDHMSVIIARINNYENSLGMDWSTGNRLPTPPPPEPPPVWPRPKGKK
jgi:hypothetical protein